MKSTSSQKSKRINIRVSKNQFNIIKSNAKKLKLPTSKYIRLTSLHGRSFSAREIENRRQRSATFNDRFHGLERKYQGIGENLNQAMKQCYIYGLDKSHDPLLEEVKVARQEVRALDNDVQKLKNPVVKHGI